VYLELQAQIRPLLSINGAFTEHAQRRTPTHSRLSNVWELKNLSDRTSARNLTPGKSGGRRLRKTSALWDGGIFSHSLQKPGISGTPGGFLVSAATTAKPMAAYQPRNSAVRQTILLAKSKNRTTIPCSRILAAIFVVSPFWQSFRGGAT